LTAPSGADQSSEEPNSGVVMQEDDTSLTGLQRVQSVVVAHQILETLSKTPNGATLSELARLLGMTPPRVLRHLATMTDLQLVERSGNEPVYRLGVGLVRLAEHAATQHDITRISLPAMRRLNDEHGEATYLVRERNGTAVIWASFESRDIPHLSMPPGMSFSLSGSACGRVLLAFGEPRTVSPPLFPTLSRESPDPIGDDDTLAKRLKLIRRQYFDSYGTEGANAFYSMSVPVLDHRNRAIASIGIIGFSILIKDRKTLLHDALLKAGRSISQELGNTAGWPPGS